MSPPPLSCIGIHTTWSCGCPSATLSSRTYLELAQPLRGRFYLGDTLRQDDIMMRFNDEMAKIVSDDGGRHRLQARRVPNIFRQGRNDCKATTCSRCRRDLTLNLSEACHMRIGITRPKGAGYAESENPRFHRFRLQNLSHVQLSAWQHASLFRHLPVLVANRRTSP